MKTTITEIAKAMLYAVIVFGGGFLAGRCCGKTSRYADLDFKTDTLIVYDTIVEIRPSYELSADLGFVEVPVTGTGKDTAAIRDTGGFSPSFVDNLPVRFTGKIRGMDYIRLPLEQRKYEGGNYAAWVSGYRPRLDSIAIWKPTTVITNTYRPNPKRWGIGIQAGYGVGISNGRITAKPYLGIGVSWNFLMF